MRKKKIVFEAALVLIAVAVVAGLTAVSCQRTSLEKKEARDKSTVYTCPMHPAYLSSRPGACPICGMKLVPVASIQPNQAAGENGRLVKIDPTVVQNIGVRTEKAAFRDLIRDIRTSAVVQADERRQVIVTAKVMGYIEKLHVNYTGQRVGRGQPLFELYSPDLVGAQAEYLTALSSPPAMDSGRLLASSRQRLLNWDLTPDQIAALEKRGMPSKTLEVYSPADGIVTEKMVTEGQSVQPGMALYKIADYSRVWVVGEIYQQDIPLVITGQRAEVLLDYYPGRHFYGTVSYIAPELDVQSRTLAVRVELVNTPDLKIKPGMNATVVLRSALAKRALAVPDQAVIRSGLRTLLIISRGNGLFEPREVSVGQSAGGYIEVLRGVQQDEEIVVSSQFLIDAESNLKSAVTNMTSGSVKPAGDSSVQRMAPAPIPQQPERAETGPSQTAREKKGAAMAYTCPMHPQVLSDKPGKCPLCGMKLAPKK